MASKNTLRQLFVRLGLIGDKNAKSKLKDFRKSLKDTGGEVTRFRKKLSARNLFKKFSSGMKAVIGDTKVFRANLAALVTTGLFNKLGRGISFVTSQFKDLLVTSSQLAAVQEQAENNLENILKISGDFTPQAFEGLKTFASSLQDISTVGDEVILKGLALAKSFKATNDQAKLIVEAAVNFSAATGKTFDEAIRQISKTLGGFAGELGEVSTEIKALTKEELLAGKAAEVLNKQFAGLAQKNVTSFSGQLQQLFNVIGDLKEVIGAPINEVLLPAIRDAKEALKNASPIFNRFGQNLARTAQILIRLFQDFGGKDFFESAIDNIGQFIVDVALLFEDLIRFLTGRESFIGNLLGEAGGFGNVLKNVLNSIVDPVADFVVDVLKRVWDKLWESTEEIGEKAAAGTVDGLTKGFTGGGTSGAPAFFSSDSPLMQGLSALGNLFSGMSFSGSGSGSLGVDADAFRQAAGASTTTNNTTNNFNQQNKITTPQTGAAAANELLQTFQSFRYRLGVF